MTLLKPVRMILAQLLACLTGLLFFTSVIASDTQGAESKYFVLHLITLPGLIKIEGSMPCENR